MPGPFPARPQSQGKSPGNEVAEGEQTSLNSRRSSGTERKGYANELYTSDSYVNTLNVADFNLISRAIQGDTHRFELIERFIKVRNLV